MWSSHPGADLFVAFGSHLWRLRGVQRCFVSDACQGRWVGLALGFLKGVCDEKGDVGPGGGRLAERSGTDGGFCRWLPWRPMRRLVVFNARLFRLWSRRLFDSRLFWLRPRRLFGVSAAVRRSGRCRACPTSADVCVSALYDVLSGRRELPQRRGANGRPAASAGSSGAASGTASR